jgi:hypothetical protein
MASNEISIKPYDQGRDQGQDLEKVGVDVGLEKMDHASAENLNFNEGDQRFRVSSWPSTHVDEHYQLVMLTYLPYPDRSHGMVPTTRKTPIIGLHFSNGP